MDKQYKTPYEHWHEVRVHQSVGDHTSTESKETLYQDFRKRLLEELIQDNEELVFLENQI